MHFFFHTFAGNMKKRSYIVLLALAIICMMMMVVVPHHHHAMKACLVQEICQQDGRVNDRHTQHSERTDTHHVIPITGKCLSIGISVGLERWTINFDILLFVGLAWYKWRRVAHTLVFNQACALWHTTRLAWTAFAVRPRAEGTANFCFVIFIFYIHIKKHTFPSILIARQQ